MKYFRIVLVFILLITSFLFLPIPTAACSCVEEVPVKKELNRSSAVFRGEVLDIKEKPEFWKAVQFKVNETWKGPNEAEILIHTANQSSACGFDFQIGKEYLVYASVNDYFGDDFLVTGICDRTSPLVMQQAEEDMQILGKGLLPGSSNLSFDVIGLLVGLGAVIIVVFLMARKSKIG